MGDPFGNGIGSGEGDSKLDPNDKLKKYKRKYNLKKRKFIIVLLMKITI
ncbi:hypothetical protein NW733_02670 [Mycoplasmopsis felis]|nr:hypothetical protein [Mycoplasmopsis felis]MCU9931597.1 hypothetical protein [Mycoplasmopsis felis]